MKELRIDEIQESLKNEIYKLNKRPFYASIFENKNLGLAYKLNKATLIKCVRSPSAFLAGDMSKEDVDEMTAFFKDQEIKLFCNQKHFKDFICAGWKLIPRVEMYYNKGYLQLKEIVHGKVETLNENNFRKCNWYNFMCGISGGEEVFLANNFGFVSIIDNEIAGECYSCAVGDNKAEIAVITNEKYKNQGIASVLSGMVINECLKRSLAPIWSCVTENVASFKTALKLGFEINEYYFILTINAK